MNCRKTFISLFIALIILCVLSIIIGFYSYFWAGIFSTFACLVFIAILVILIVCALRSPNRE